MNQMIRKKRKKEKEVYKASPIKWQEERKAFNNKEGNPNNFFSFEIY